MGKSLPILNISGLADQLGSFAGQIQKFMSGPLPTPGPGDGRTVDDFKPYLIALNLTKRCNLKCAHCYLDATTKAGGASEIAREHGDRARRVGGDAGDTGVDQRGKGEKRAAAGDRVEDAGEKGGGGEKKVIDFQLSPGGTPAKPDRPDRLGIGSSGPSEARNSDGPGSR